MTEVRTPRRSGRGRAGLSGLTYDLLMASAERRMFAAIRKDLLTSAAGRVIEVGGGTGANLLHYPRGAVERLDVVEPSESMAARFERRRPRWALLHPGSVEELHFPDAAFDAAVGTLVFCSVPDMERGFAELRRVLVPGGRLHFLEHVRSQRPRVGSWQDRLDGVWSRMCGGCHANRRTVEAIEAAGFEVERLDQREVGWQGGLVRDFAWGIARSA